MTVSNLPDGCQLHSYREICRICTHPEFCPYRSPAPRPISEPEPSRPVINHFTYEQVRAAVDRIPRTTTEIYTRLQPNHPRGHTTRKRHIQHLFYMLSNLRDKGTISGVLEQQGGHKIASWWKP